jgi:AcrR family transcriptional regulator
VKKGEERRRQLVEAAIQQIVDAGIGETTVAAVAKRAGISKGIIHYYYEEKRELLRDALTVVEEEFISGAIEPIDESEPSAEQLTQLVYNALPLSEFGFRSQRVWFNLLATAMVDDELATLQQQYHRRWREFVRDHLARLVREGDLPASTDPEDLARVIVAFCDGMSLLLLTAAAAEREHVERNVAVFVDGLLPSK